MVHTSGSSARGRTRGWGLDLCSLKLKMLVTQSYPTLFDPTDCSPPGSPVHEILQARILEWVAVPFSRGSSQPKDGTHVSRVSGTGRWVLYY